MLEERDDSGGLLVRYVYGHDLISQTRDSATSYYHYDGLGSTRALTASSEAVTDTYNYDAFGNLLDKTGTTTNTYLFTGEFFDANVGFYYLRARYMNAAIGRFITMDPFAGRNRDPYSLHKYLYAHANPVNNIDPSGQLTLTELTVVGGILGALTGMNVYRVFFDDPSASTWERALGYVTWGAGGALVGGLLTYGSCYMLIGSAASTAPAVSWLEQVKQWIMKGAEYDQIYWEQLSKADRRLYMYGQRTFNPRFWNKLQDILEGFTKGKVGVDYVEGVMERGAWLIENYPIRSSYLTVPMDFLWGIIYTWETGPDPVTRRFLMWILGIKS